MYITNVSGHHQAALSIEKAIKIADPNSEVLNINGFNYVTPLIEKFVHKTYLGVVKKIPFIWDCIYDNPSVVRRSSKLKNAINKKNQLKIRKLFEDEGHRVAVCSQAFPCGFVAEYKKLNPSKDIKLIAVITDFVPHSYWVYDEVNFYIVPSKEAMEILINKGVQPNKIKVLGIPIDPKFNINMERVQVANEMGIPLIEPIVLVMGGGHGIGPIEKLITTLDKDSRNMRLLVVAGINKKLFKILNKKRFTKNVHVFGYVEHIDKLMTVSDMIITKPGGITTSEALAKNVPMIIIKPLPGQEQNNTKFLLKMGVAEKADSVKQTVEKLHSLLDEQGKVMAMKERITSIAMPDSSEKIAQLTLSLC